MEFNFGRIAASGLGHLILQLGAGLIFIELTTNWYRARKIKKNPIFL